MVHLGEASTSGPPVGVDSRENFKQLAMIIARDREFNYAVMSSVPP